MDTHTYCLAVAIFTALLVIGSIPIIRADRHHQAAHAWERHIATLPVRVENLH